MKGGLEMKVQGLKTSKAAPAAECKEGNQKGSLLLEAIVVLGMIATFTPMLYKHVADRRADIENINRANTLLYLQHKAEDYLKDPDNITALVEELGHNQHKEIYPSEMGAGSNFDGRYIVGIRREDENNKPVLKAMIIDTVHTGSDLRAAKVAELIGISAGIYTAVDPDAAWGINGIWSEPLSRYFDTTNIPTGAVAITTEYNKAKYRVNISDILVDADLDMGEFEVTAEQINAVAIAAQNGTLDQLIAQNVNAATKVTSPKLVATEKLCVGGEDAENCIESWEGLGGGGGDTSDLMLVQLCTAGMSESCMAAFAKGLNLTCSDVDAVYDRFGAAYPTPKIYGLSYGNGTEYVGSIRAKCGGTQFVVSDISTATLTNPVEQVGGSAFAITTPGWYQVTLMGEAGTYIGGLVNNAAGGILIANTYYDADTLITLKGIEGWDNVSDWSGAGVALWDTMNTTGAPKLVAGGGARGGAGGYIGGYDTNGIAYRGYSWNGTRGNSTYCCYTAPCNNGATGGCYYTNSSTYEAGGTGTGSSGYPCPSGYTCTTITGGSIKHPSTSVTITYPASTYGNWGTNTLTGGKGYASIRWCGPSGSSSSCPDACSTDSDCSGATPYCNNGFCSETQCSTDANCSALDPSKPYCVEGICAPYNSGRVMYEVNNISTKSLSSTVAQVGTYTIPVAGKYQIRLMGEMGAWANNSTAGGILIANTYYNAFSLITIKGIKGYYYDSNYWGGAGIALWDTIGDVTGVPKLAAGGSGVASIAGGGYLGGWGWYRGDIRDGYGWNGSRGGSKYCCYTAPCNNGATGGCDIIISDGRFASGGTGTGSSGYLCPTDYVCTTVTGGSGDWNGPTSSGYSSVTYGNWSVSGAVPGYAAIVYCGPDANSECPASCGNGVSCTTGTCNYHTGLCQ